MVHLITKQMFLSFEKLMHLVNIMQKYDLSYPNLFSIMVTEMDYKFIKIF